MPPPPLRPECYWFPLSVKRRCWWSERCCLRERKKVKREEKGKRGKPRGLKRKRKGERGAAALLTRSATKWPWPDGQYKWTHLLPRLGSVPNLSLLRWRRSEAALEMDRAEMCKLPFFFLLCWKTSMSEDICSADELVLTEGTEICYYIKDSGYW